MKNKYNTNQSHLFAITFANDFTLHHQRGNIHQLIYA
jgi:hypothetical protein